MAVNILTPSAIWDKIKFDNSPSVEMIGEYKDGKIVYSRFYILADFGDDKKAKIYCSLARDTSKTLSPAVFVVQDFNDGADEAILKYLAKKGYVAFTFDFAGKAPGSANRTVYSEKLDYANYQVAKDNMQNLNGDVTTTCWNIWQSVTNQAFEYLKAQAFIKEIGALGIGEAATVLWQLVAMKDDFACSVFIENAGWQIYKDFFKFGEQGLPRFTDEQMAYIAGVEAQSYAQLIDCPVLVLSPTNSNKFDLDRANDTANRLSGKTYSAVDYSVGMRGSVGIEALIDMQMFFDKYLRGKDKIILPSDMEVKNTVANEKLMVTVFPDVENLKDVILYVAEQTINPALRCWTECYSVERDEEKFVFEVNPYKESEIVVFFARAEYKNGFTICSAVYAKKFSPNELGSTFKSNIIYSSREEGKESIFAPAVENTVRPTGINLTEEKVVNVAEGPDEIVGVNSFGGVLTFNVNIKKYKPNDDALLMLDVYMQNSGSLTVKLISDYFNQKIEYVATEEINGGNVWHKIRLDINKFKTVEGRPLRNYENIEAIEIDAEGYYLINNILWV